jgi:nucleotidyltransferase/DNA polymerase involved in DNA repair
MSRYKEVSKQVFDIFHEFTPQVEGLSLDEAFLDVTASLRLLGDGETIATEIRRRIRADTGLTASIGIAPNKLLAKIASDLNKPDGMCRLGPDNLFPVLDALPIQKLFGVGDKSLPAVQAAGIRTFGDLRLADDATVWRAFGKHGKAMRARAAGIDERPVVPDREEKSISAEETFRTDIHEAAELERQLGQLADRTASRLRAHALAAGTVWVKIRRRDFTTYTRQRRRSRDGGDRRHLWHRARPASGVAAPRSPGPRCGCWAWVSATYRPRGRPTVRCRRSGIAAGRHHRRHSRAFRHRRADPGQFAAPDRGPKTPARFAATLGLV